jgi:TolB-like protein/class 3 adenylate cyclase/Flp pilus assembly protein TadD
MAAEVKKEIALEIAHVLFIDIVGYSKLSVNEQNARVEELNGIVRATEQVQKAEAAGRLLKIATGDGMALVFYISPEAPAQCAVEISRALKERPRLQVRMGVHSGPVSGVVDVNERTNVTGAGINMAQRVMDCGDAGHILLSKHVAEDLAEYDSWRPLLHDLGACEVKHGVRVEVTNLYSEEVGNAELPRKFQAVRKHRARIRWAEVGLALVLLGVIIAAFIFVSRPPARRALSGAEKSIAVLPFENLSEEKANAFFAEGVQDEILTDLAKVADLKVISRTSVMQYKTGVGRNLREIGQQLGVTHLLEGSVQRVANRIRVNAQLIDARNDAHLWAQTYDRELADVFAIQTEIAKTIAEQLQAKLSPNEKLAIEERPTTNLEAYGLYVRGSELVETAPFSADQKDRFLEAIRLLDQAVERDPAFLLAYCKLARAHDQFYLFGYDHTPARLSLAENAVNNALRLQPDSGEAHLALALHLYSKLDYDRAHEELAIARSTLPNDPRIFTWWGFIDRRQGHWAESASHLEQALELDPYNEFLLQQISLSYANLRDYAKEAEALDRVLALKPSDVDTQASRAYCEFVWRADTRPFRVFFDGLTAHDPVAAQKFAWWGTHLAMAERNTAEAERMLALLGDDRFGWETIMFSRAFGEGLVARMNGDAAAARTAFMAARAAQEKILQAQPDYGSAIVILGLIDAGLGRKDDALREGRRAMELLPVTKDSINGALIIEFFGVICAWVGEKDLAIEQLRRGIQLPGLLGYGEYKLMPFWDPLRGDPRFERIVASLAPKE